MESVKWRDGEDESVAVIGGKVAPITLRCERWTMLPLEWAASVLVGHGPQAVGVHRSGGRWTGHPSREAAKEAAVKALRAWLAGVQAGLDRGGR